MARRPCWTVDDPHAHQIPQRLIAVENTIEPENLVGPAQGISQLASPRTGDLQWVQHLLAFDQSLSRGSLQGGQFGVIVG
jgi:hypothetical protein